jgi:hypothetical protein
LHNLWHCYKGRLLVCRQILIKRDSCANIRAYFSAESPFSGTLRRGIIRPSNYADFYIEKKKEFLAHLSFCFSFDLKTTIFSSDDIRRCYNKIYKRHNLPASQAKKVVNEIESHSGIIIQNGFDTFQFSHKSLQEYLTGKYLFSLPSVPDPDIIKVLPNEIAIAVSLSSSPNLYFYSFIIKRKHFKDDFWEVFLDRLLEERPDFTEDPAILVFFLIMIEENPLRVFAETLISLIKHTNLKITFQSFLKVYEKKQTFGNKLLFEHKELNKALDKRNYLPGQLLIEKTICELIGPN